MTSRRVLKAAQAIREVVGMAILTDLRDPRIQDVTVTRVEVSADLRLAKIHVSVMGDEKKQQLSVHGLQSSAGYLQQKVAKRIDTRYTPRLTFVLDKGVKNSIEIQRIIGELDLNSDTENADNSFNDADNLSDDETPEPRGADTPIPPAND